jgi:hypothetical protein
MSSQGAAGFTSSSGGDGTNFCFRLSSEWYFSTTILQKMAGMCWPKYKTAFVFCIDHSLDFFFSKKKT